MIYNKYTALAKNMALKSTSKFRLGAVLVKKRRVISTGYNNMRKSHPAQQRYADDPDIILGIHAEVDCCIGVSAQDLQGSEMWVVRLYHDGSLALAKPCKVCQRFLRSVGVQGVWYSTTQGMEWLQL